MLDIVVGCVQEFGVRFLAMFGISEHCTLGSKVVCCVLEFGVQFLAVPGISQKEHGIFDSGEGCIQESGSTIPSFVRHLSQSIEH